MAERRFSHKREQIYQAVCSRREHPTAEMVYQQLKPQFPDLSLGTVYRNLAAFKAEGVIDSVGVVNGLAYTEVGGALLRVEAAAMPGSGKVELTGSLGDVMKESAKAAITCVRSLCDRYGIDKDFYKTKDIHIHFPEGAVPKDGPSAGIAITTALLSALTDRPVRHDVAMTGEVTLRGRVMPIGGLREKTMGALRAGIRTVILPKENEKDLDEIDPNVRAKLRFVLVETVDAVFAEALVYPEAASAARLDTVLPGAAEGGKLPALRV